MDNNVFIPLCKAMVTNEYLENGIDLDDSKIYVVWLNKTLNNNKALLSTNVEDGMYYEITYNGAKQEVYFDSYKKTKNFCVSQVDYILNKLKEDE